MTFLTETDLGMLKFVWLDRARRYRSVVRLEKSIRTTKHELPTRAMGSEAFEELYRMDFRNVRYVAMFYTDY